MGMLNATSAFCRLIATVREAKRCALICTLKSGGLIESSRFALLHHAIHHKLSESTDLHLVCSMTWRSE